MKKKDISIITTIKQNYQRFTNVEKEIAAFFLENEEMIDFSAKNVAEKIYVSVPSLSRFAQKCGYVGYREFIFAYKEYLTQQKATKARQVHDTIKTYEDIVREMSILLNRKQVDHVVDMMSHKARVIVCGKGSSGLSALEMESRFMRVGLKIQAITDGERMRMQAIFVEPGDLVIGLSISGTAENVRYLMRKAKEKKAATIMITAYPSEEMKDFCDEIVVVPALPNMDQGNLISPQFPLLMMQDVLYSHYKESNQIQKEMLHSSTIRALRGKGEKDNENL